MATRNVALGGTTTLSQARKPRYSIVVRTTEPEQLVDQDDSDQRIIQRVREGERSKIRDEFSTKLGELLSGEVQQIERGKLVVMLNKFREAEAIIPYREQNHREHFHQGEPIRAVLKRVEETPKGPRLILSRADPLFVKALFKLEVPEIQQGIVEIRASAREVGSRTKIAVFSRDDSIDPVGACVGARGGRAHIRQADLATRAACERLVAQARDELGDLDVWVNNAGADVLTG